MNGATSSARRVVSLFAGWLQRVLLLWADPVWSALQALLAYAVLASRHGSVWPASSFAYHNYLADAFLHGQLHLWLIPASLHDLSIYNERVYLNWGPFPAVLLMPFVALFGVQLSDIIVTITLGAVNVSLVALVLRQADRRGVLELARFERALLVLLFAFGTVHLILAPLGSVWFTTQLAGFFCVALAYLATLGLQGLPAFALAGLALAGGMLTRNHLVFAGLWPACYLLHRHHFLGWRRLAAYALLGLLPIALGVVLVGLYNWLRFGSLFESGISYHTMAELFESDFERYGATNLHYLLRNLFYQYLAYPFPWRPASQMGGSLFLLSPVFFATLWGIASGRPRWSVWALLGTIVFVASPILVWMSTGWIQFGPRYTLDFTLPLLMLTAYGVRRWPAWVTVLLTVISIVHYLVGSYYFGL